MSKILSKKFVLHVLFQFLTLFFNYLKTFQPAISVNISVLYTIKQLSTSFSTILQIKIIFFNNFGYSLSQNKNYYQKLVITLKIRKIHQTP